MRQGYPTTRMLASRLRRALDPDGVRGEVVRILERSADERSSSFPSEVVTVLLGSRETRTLRCKYSPSDRRRPPAWHTANGHRHGVAYEARVYRQVLEPLGMTTPRLWGTHEAKDGPGWLAIEYLDGSLRINSVPWELGSAASWIAEFHTRNEIRLAEPAVQFLSTYSTAYYRGWARRTLAHAWRYRRDCPCIQSLEETFERAIAALLEPPLTIIHGEYYPANVLWRRQAVHPIDWESAARAAGEIDLASLTDEWPPDSIEECETGYCKTRWPAGFDQAWFARRLSAARLYLVLRWAGVPGAFRRPEDRRYYLRRIDRAVDRFRQHLAGRAAVAAAG